MATELASTAKKAYGFTFSRRNTSTLVYDEVHNIVDLGLPNIDNSEVEKTHHGSPNRKREFGLTLGEDAPYDVKFHFSWDDATHVLMYTDCFGLVEDVRYQIDWPDNDKSKNGIAYIRNWKWGAMTPENLQEVTVTVRESPAWDWDT